MQARQAQLSEILTQQRTLTIPVYQRHYRWDRRDLRTLWLDILAQYKRLLDFEGVAENLRPTLYKSVGNHYMGTVVLAKRSQSETIYDVIDGQQRLTSLSLLLCAIREAWYPLRATTGGNSGAPATDRDALMQLRATFNGSNLVIPSDEIGGLSTPRFRPHSRDQIAYDACVLYDGGKRLTSADLGLPNDTLILNAFGFFLEQLNMTKDRVAADPMLGAYSDCFPLRWKLLKEVVSTRLRFVEVITDDVDDSNAIFESLNAKGRSLEQIDLLKNYMFLLLNDDDRVMREFWSPLTAALGKEDDLGRFMWADLVSRGKSAPQSKLHQTKQQELRGLASNNLEQVFDELTRLRAESKGYLAVTNPTSHASDSLLRDALVDLNRAGGATALPLVLYVLRYAKHKATDSAGVVRAVRLIESYLMRRFLVGMDGHNLNSYFSGMLTRAHSEDNELSLDNSDDLEARVSKLLNAIPVNWPSDDRLLAALQNVQFYGRGEASQRMLVFKRLDKSYGQSYSINYSETDLTIEHILPQNPDSAGSWVAESAASGVSYEELRSEFGDSLVNLVPLLRSENSGVGNKPFFQKLAVYAQSSLKVTSQLAAAHNGASNPVWGETQLRDRAAVLMPHIAEIWPRPVDTTPPVVPTSVGAGSDTIAVADILEVSDSADFEKDDDS